MNDADNGTILANLAAHALTFVPKEGTLGLGTGRAASAFVRALASLPGERIRKLRCVATSEATASLARSLGLSLVSLAEVETVDLTVDGADEVAPNLDLIKGYGGALVREKVVAAASAKLVIVATKDKLVSRLGMRGKLPVEVVPFAWPFCARQLHRLLGKRPVLRQHGEHPYVSDGENYILDCPVDPIDDPHQLELAIRSVPGVVGTGLFLGMASVVLVGDSNGVQELRRDE